MSECEVCGKPVFTLRKAKINGIVFQVCDECVKLGEEIRISKPKPIIKRVYSFGEEIELIPDFSEKIKRAREKRNLSQKEVAEKIKERLSIIKRAEQGFKPEESVVKKLEEFFNLELHQEIKEIKPSKKALKEEKLTLGDIAVIKKKKN